MGAGNFVHLEECDILAVTDKAVLVRYGDEDHWIPVSQLADRDDHTHEVGDKGVTVSITEWLAEQKGIEA